MQHLDLTDDEAAALTQELHDIVENDRYPFSPRIRTLRGILAKLKPEPVREPNVYAPPRVVARKRVAQTMKAEPGPPIIAAASTRRSYFAWCLAIQASASASVMKSLAVVVGRVPVIEISTANVPSFSGMTQ